MPDDDEWGDEWIREDEEWHDPREDDPTRVGEYADADYDEVVDAPYEDPDPDGFDDRYADEPDARRRGLLVAMVAVLVLIVGVALAALLVKSGDDSDSDVTADRSSTTTSVRTTLTSLGQLPGAVTSSSTSTSLDPDGPATGGALGSSTTSTTKKPATTTTTATDPDITNDPDCVEGVTGPATAGNEPMRISFCVDDQAPKVGQVVQVIGTAVDKDAQIEPDCIKVSWEGESFGECAPPTVPGPGLVINRDFTFTHAFTKPGTYTIHVGALSDDPKSSNADATYKITVHA